MKVKTSLFIQLTIACYMLIIVSCQKEDASDNHLAEIDAYEKYLDDLNSGRLDSSAFIITRDGGSVYYRYYFGSTVYHDQEYVLYHYSLCKYDRSGNHDWMYTFGNGAECNDIHEIVESDDGSIVFTAHRCKPDLSDHVHALVKLDRNGKFLWERTFDGLGIEQLGPVCKTADGGFALAGITNAAGEYDWILLKTDAEGNLEWSRKYGEESLTDAPQCLIQTEEYGYFITVLADNSHDQAAQLNRLYRLDQSGQWLGRTDLPYGTQYCNDMVKAHDAGYILAIPYIHAETDELSLSLLKISNSGEIIWSREHEMEFHISLEAHLMQLPDSGYFFIDRNVLIRFSDSGDLDE